VDVASAEQVSGEAPATGELSTEIRRAGLKATRPRLLVLALLRNTAGHLPAERIIAGLAERGTPLARGSVYNVLTALSGAGLIMMADAGPGRTLYEAGTQWHHHFVCSQCGGVDDVPCATEEKPCIRPEGPAYENADIVEAQVIYRGRCADCAAA
jgi:Fe2+ or Zn2+ uptake regulation protein